MIHTACAHLTQSQVHDGDAPYDPAYVSSEMHTCHSDGAPTLSCLFISLPCAPPRQS